MLGVFAAGDVRLDSMKRVASAVGEGAMAVYRPPVPRDDMTGIVDPQDLRPIALFDPPATTSRPRSPRRARCGRSAPARSSSHEGDLADVWWVLVDGSITLRRHVGAEDTLMGMLTTPGQWAGGFTVGRRRLLPPRASERPTGGSTRSRRALRLLADEWFAFAVHFIRGTGTVRRVEATVREREALVALGTLAAGLAHELNNPASAATRAVDALGTTSVSMYEALSRLALSQMTSTSSPRWTGCDGRSRPARRRPTRSTRPSSRRPSRGGSPTTGSARTGCWPRWRPRRRPRLVRAPRRRPARTAARAGVEWVSCLSLNGLLGEVKDSTRRVSDLVGRVRSYTQLDRASLHPTDLHEGLDSTVVMLAHKLGDGIVVERDYGDVPRSRRWPPSSTRCGPTSSTTRPMPLDGQGTIRLRTRVDDDGWVPCRGPGPGMSEETAKRLFDPFYTTKPVGQGTGPGSTSPGASSSTTTTARSPRTRRPGGPSCGSGAGPLGR